MHLCEEASIVSTFIETSQYQRFVDVCESCQRQHVLGVCYGAVGVGKAFLVRRSTHWDQMTHRLRREKEA